MPVQHPFFIIIIIIIIISLIIFITLLSTLFRCFYCDGDDDNFLILSDTKATALIILSSFQIKNC